MASEVIMPQMGFDMKEGTLVRWIKREGDDVASGDIIAEIETDKAVVEIEAFDSGVLRQTLIGEGTTVPVGEVHRGDRRRGRGGCRAAGAEGRAGKGGGPGRGLPRRQRLRLLPLRPPRGEVKASPLAKREAQKLGIDIAAVPGTGPNGRVTKKDVTDFAAGAAQAPATPAAPTPPPKVAAPAGGPKRGEVVALSKMRDAIARSMSYSKQHIPHVYLTAAVDMTDAASLRSAAQRGAPRREDQLQRHGAQGLRHGPGHAPLDERQLHRRRHRCEAAHQRRHGDRAGNRPHRAGYPGYRHSYPPRHRPSKQRHWWRAPGTAKLSVEEYTGATFNVTNLGMYGVEEFTAIITPPQAAALAVGAVTPTTVVRDGEVQVADLMRITLSLDHRVADGAQGAEFLAEVRRLLEIRGADRLAVDRQPTEGAFCWEESASQGAGRHNSKIYGYRHGMLGLRST